MELLVLQAVVKKGQVIASATSAPYCDLGPYSDSDWDWRRSGTVSLLAVVEEEVVVVVVVSCAPPRAMPIQPVL